VFKNGLGISKINRGERLEMLEYAKIFVEFCFGLGMFVNAFLFIPQIISLFKTKNSDGFSFATFIGFNIVQVFCILHGYIHKDYLLMLGMLLSLIFCGTISFLIILYKPKKKQVY
jgi:MtN3 and saliva related transmembrane protein